MKFIPLFLFSAFLFSGSAQAEPWLASRFSQNCASCHAPGRVNVASSEKRCSLSCKSCHTNPSGGGLRNAYGKWNQERWLNSMYFKSYRLNEPRPMPTADQSYADGKIGKLGTDKELKRKAAASGFKLKETSSYLADSHYDRSSSKESVVESDREMSLAKIPDDDPYRIRRKNPFNAGLDSRVGYMDFSYKSKTRDDKVQNGFLMATDLSVSVEPFHGVTAVVESRFLNDVNSPAWDAGFENQSGVRSAYVLVDDLPYNSYAQYGLYRPLFGHHSSDNSSLLNEATGFGTPYIGGGSVAPVVRVKPVFKTLSVGMAGDHPFFNLHMIEPANAGGYATDKGFAANLGANFRVLGLYGMLSYWTTTADYVTAKYKRNMNSFTGGGTFGRYTFALDVTRVTSEKIDVRIDTGNVLTIENRLRFWRENYLKAVYETLNTARDLTEGSTSAYSLGISSFLVSSLELEIVYKNLKENLPNDNSVEEKSTMAMFHLFF